MITLDTEIIDNLDLPVMAVAQFQAILAGASSPAASVAADSYQAILDIAKNQPVLPWLCLAIFHHESGYGLKGVTFNYNTKNPGNCKTLDLQRLRVGYITVPMADGKSRTFVRYGSWPDGFTDLAWRLIDPAYSYRQANAKTARDIFAIFAPGSDNNDPLSYANDVVADLNQWMQEGQTVASGQDPNAKWEPSSNFDAGRDGYVISHITDHMTAGTSSLNWLRGAAGGSDNQNSSSSYLIERDGTRYQLVNENDTEWADGALPYNRSGVSIEHESADGSFTEAQIVASIAEHLSIAKRRGWTRLVHPTNAILPEVPPDAPVHTGFVYGHSQIPDPNNPNAGGGVDHHLGCPGTQFPFDRIVSSVNAQLAGGTVPMPTQPADNPCRYFAETGHTLCFGFRAFWEDHKDALAIFGFPISQEFQENGKTVQYFERCRFEINKAVTSNPWQVELGLLGVEDAKQAQVANPTAFAAVPQP